jgi:uncharacterized membrane protein YccC
MSHTPWARLVTLLDHASLQPDLSRAIRATVAFMVPLLLAATGEISVDMSLVAIAGQNIAMVDIRGDYRVRLALLLAMAAVFVAAAAIGATVSAHLAGAVLATGLMAVIGGAARHLSSDYGPSLAISSTLVFFLAFASPHARDNVGVYALAAGAGGLWGVMIQVALWPFRPQHALRRTVADSWLAVAGLFEALAPVGSGEQTARHESVLQREAALRIALDHTYAILEALPAGGIRARLEPLNLASARLATRVVALNTAIEGAMGDTGSAALAVALEPVLESLANLARSAALTVVSRQPAHLAAFEVRLRELTSILAVLRTRLGPTSAHAQITEIVSQIERMLPEVHQTLRATVERAAERAPASLELPDLRVTALRPLASALNLTLHVDPALVRFTLRLAALTMLAVLGYKLHGSPHGYWLPFTVVVVLQPDYGSTRQRAVQRVLGTLAGSVLASLFLWLHPPWLILMIATSGLIFAFGFYVKRNYAVAIFFVTLFIVLLTEAHEPVSIAFTLERLASTLAGGVLALIAALVFWPVWERDRLPGILARAVQANGHYLASLMDRLAAGAPFDRSGIDAKRQAEAANAAAFSSLRRLTGDPKNRQEGLEHAAALANGLQRLTRILNVLSLHLMPGSPITDDSLVRFRLLAEEAFAAIALGIESAGPPTAFARLLKALEQPGFSSPSVEPQRWIFGQLNRAATELSTLLVTLQQAAPAWEETSVQKQPS